MNLEIEWANRGVKARVKRNLKRLERARRLKDQLEKDEASYRSAIKSVKPIIFKKQVDKTATKSSVLSSKDFKIAKLTFEAIDKKKWQKAIKLSRKAKDKTLYNIYEIFRLLKS